MIVFMIYDEAKTVGLLVVVIFVPVVVSTLNSVIVSSGLLG